MERVLPLLLVLPRGAIGDAAVESFDIDPHRLSSQEVGPVDRLDDFFVQAGSAQLVTKGIHSYLEPLAPTALVGLRPQPFAKNFSRHGAAYARDKQFQ